MEISPEAYVEHIGRESGRFLDVLRGVGGATRVPSCPDWDVDDLLFHLGARPQRGLRAAAPGPRGADPPHRRRAGGGRSQRAQPDAGRRRGAEVLDLMYGNPPDWGAFTPDPSRVVRFAADDVERTWTVTVGRFVGTSPSGEHVDVGCLGWVPDDQEPAAEVVGTVGDLDCWLWNRDPWGTVSATGDDATLAALADVTGVGID